MDLAPNTYYFMQLVRLTATMHDQNQQPQDPSTVTLLVKQPGGATVTYTYGADPSFVRDDRGSYHYDLSGTVAGTVTYAWRTSGTYQGAAEGKYVILPSTV